MGISNELKAAIEESGRTSYDLGKEAGIAPTNIDRFKRGERGLTLETADKLARVLQLALGKAPPTWQREGDDWVLKVNGVTVAQVHRSDDDGTWRWHRMTTIKEHGQPPATGKASSRRDAQKKAWP